MSQGIDSLADETAIEENKVRHSHILLVLAILSTLVLRVAIVACKCLTHSWLSHRVAVSFLKIAVC
jgi:hypothetical protein